MFYLILSFGIFFPFLSLFLLLVFNPIWEQCNEVFKSKIQIVHFVCVCVRVYLFFFVTINMLNVKFLYFCLVNGPF